jgi:YD repeat-containing protein
VGQVISQTDAKGRTSQRFYDVLRRLTKEIDPILGETQYSYDVRDNLLTVTDANNHTHSFTYDKVNRKKTEARPMGQTIAYQYDPNGNLTQRLSPNGAKRLFTYDDDNRLEKEEHFLPSTTVASKTMTYTYDQCGLLKTYSDGLTSGVYVYDVKGQKTSEAITFGSGTNAFTKTITRTYESNGLLKSMSYPGSTGTLNYTYDTNNQLKTYKIPGLAVNNDTLTYQYRWNAIKEITMPGNLKRTVTLDALQRPERIEVKGYGTTPGNNGAPVMDHKYTYDEVSNISKKTTLDGDYIYGYDRLDRLTDATPPVGLQSSATNLSGLPIEKYS